MTRKTTNGDYNAYAVHLLVCSLKKVEPMTLEEFKILLEQDAGKKEVCRS